ncbi:MAG: SPOR domain-containing protein [Pseudomonadota bacterium]
MKHTRLALVIALSSLTTTPVLAASMTMLQFGSFETREEADKRLSDISSKYGATLGSLPASVREIKLPPDNLTVYRTQAGPVASRADAQSICAKLATTGDECYIVQTAMVAPGTAPLAAPVAAAAALPSPQALQSDEKKDATASAPQLPVRDASSEAMLNSVSAPQAAPAAAPVVAVTPSPKMQSALDNAVAAQEATDAAVTTTTTTTAASASSTKPGFWSRMNPFSSSEPKPVPAPVAAPVINAVSPLAAPVESVSSTAVAAPVAAAVTAPVVVAAATPTVVARNEPVAPVARPSFDMAPVAAQPEAMRLPPPPAPLKAQDRANLAAGVEATKTPVSTGMITSAPLTPITYAAAPGNGIVNVEEAKRVPLTQNTAPAPLPSPILLQPPVSLSPSATLGEKTLWAQIGPFASSQAALEYWGNYRQNHPDFPVVRVRVTSSYQQQLRGVYQSWLRIGPVARMGFINSLCGTLYAKEDKTPLDQRLRCGSVTDMGIASSPQRGLLPGSRYHR